MKKRGFTLIELLAVIVILAIIALIATPIVLSIISDSKDSASLRSAEMYLKGLETSVATATLNEKHIEDGTYEITKDGDICLTELTNEKLCSSEEKILVVEMNGEEPTSGTVTIESGKVKNIVFIYSNEKTIVKNEDGKTVQIPTPKSFAEDDWSTIVANVRAGNLIAYKVGDTREITLTSTDTNIAGTYTIRIANTSTPAECSANGYSQTACGFVIEFADIISDHVMNSIGSSVGGWELSPMRTYVNNDIYNSFPEELKEYILDTYVVSGHESGKTSNYKTTDKVYLLSTKEVWGKEGTSNIIVYDTAETETRQLDYYKNLGVTTSKYSGAIKNGSWWWLRSVHSDATHAFCIVNDSGLGTISHAYNNYGVSVAFRI